MNGASADTLIYDNGLVLYSSGGSSSRAGLELVFSPTKLMALGSFSLPQGPTWLVSGPYKK